ncbi:hypothetical protein LguiA_030954 [Lonicera macranthoides]
MNPDLYMDSNVYNAAISGDLEFLRQNKDKIGVQKTPAKNTVLHLSSQLGKLEAVKVILSMHPSLLTQANSRGETALHQAAKEGHCEVIKSLIECARKMEIKDCMVFQMLRMTNNSRDTALHEAVRYCRLETATILVEEEEAEYSFFPNYAGETPLYLVVTRGNHEILGLILRKFKSPVYTGPKGETALHGAVTKDCKDCTEELLKWKPELVNQTDSSNLTPLHYAARLGHAGRASQILSVDESVAYSTNKDYDKRTALHMAASQGHKTVIKELVSRCPSLWDMVDGFDQNVLRIALENNQVEVIEFILENCPVIGSLLTQKDHGPMSPNYTPIDLLATANLDVPKRKEHINAYMGALNNRNFTTLELELKATVNKNESAMNPKPAGPSQNVDMRQWDYRKMPGMHMIVAALIATISFIVGFTIPGGFIQSGNAYQGMAVLTKQPAFQAFIVADTLTILLSIISATIFYLIAADYIAQDKVTDIACYAKILVILALLAMMVAFAAGTYAVLEHSLALVVSICLLGCCLFLFYWFWGELFRE